jgi:predicted kinase
MIPKIYVLVGMIASGKSTYCANAAKHGQIIMNDDAIVNMLHADDYTLYDESLKILYKSIENNIISLGLCMGRTVLIDRGLNVSKKGRQRWISMARSFDVECDAIVFTIDDPEVHAKRRFAKDARGHSYDYWLKVATEHWKQYCVPTTNEGFGKIHFITYDEIINGRLI